MNDNHASHDAFTTMNIPIVILCGGKSSRMKTDKSLLSFGNHASLIQYQYERLNKTFDSVYISSKENKFDFPIRHEHIIYDEDPTLHSPLLALKTILQSVSNNQVFILTVDTPFVSIETIKMLMTQATDYDITIATTALKEHNLCGVFSQSILPVIESMLKEDMHKIGYLLKHTHTQRILCQDEQEFMNLNTKEEYEQALQRIS